MAASERYHELLLEAWELHKRKNAGYAGEDNPDTWANFRMSEALGVSALRGCLIRLSDKYIRITNLMRDPSNDQVNESLIDTLNDLAGYALIAICLAEEERDGKAEQWTFTKKVPTIPLKTLNGLIKANNSGLGPVEVDHDLIEYPECVAFGCAIHPNIL